MCLGSSYRECTSFSFSFFSRPNHPVNLLSLRKDRKSVRYLDKVDFPGSDVLPNHLVCLLGLGIYIELSSMVMLILANFNGIKQRENDDPLVSDIVHLCYAYCLESVV